MSTSLPNIIKIILEYELLSSECITQTKQRTTKFPRHLTNRKSLLKYHGSGIKPTSLSLYTNNFLVQLSPIPCVPSRASKFPLHLASPNDNPLSHCYGKPDQDRKKISRRKLSKAELPQKKKKKNAFSYIILFLQQSFKNKAKKTKTNHQLFLINVSNSKAALILFNLLGEMQIPCAFVLERSLNSL